MRKLLFAVIASIFSFSAMAGGHADWFKKAGAPYSGTVLQGVAENTPPGQFAGEVFLQFFLDQSREKKLQILQLFFSQEENYLEFYLE